MGPLEATDITADSCTLTWKPPKVYGVMSLDRLCKFSFGDCAVVHNYCSPFLKMWAILNFTFRMIFSVIPPSNTPL